MAASSLAARRPDSLSHPSHPDTDGGVKRRRRGAARLSCAECRRLKLRCDRKVPCDSCVKRGCGAICPDGSLTTGKGNRFVLASTQELHEKIAELCSRVRELEDALRESHAQLSHDLHPLLTEDLLRIKAPLQRDSSNDKNGATGGVKEEPGADVVDSFGSLSISQSGKSKYYGHTANSWYFLQNETIEEEQEDRTAGLESSLPADVLALGSTFPSSPTSSPVISEGERLTNLFWYLPSQDKASQLREMHYQRAAWMYNPITRAQFDEEVFSAFYAPSPDPSSVDPGPASAGALASRSPEDLSASGRLSVLFMVLAIGTLMDPTESPYSKEAEKYHQLARAALFKSAIFDDPTLHAVQALFLMSYYLFLADRHGTLSGSRWVIMGFAVKLAQSIGLHRDSTRWKELSPRETQIRREVFWELYVCDSWQCLTFGRPPSFSLPHVDCKFPHPLEDPTGERSFDTWKHRFSAECMSIVHDQAFGAKTPSYQTILQLDRKLRAFPVPAVLQVPGFGSAEQGQGQREAGYRDPLGLVMQQHIVLAIREMNLLYMHRGFFARAISDSPKDPLGSPYGTSVIAAYRSAGSLVALMRNLDSQLPEPTERLWFLWTHLFSCAVVLGSIVTRCPSMSLAPSALQQLDSACELFSGVAQVFRAEKVLSIMRNLQRKAHISMREHREGKLSPLNPLSHGGHGHSDTLSSPEGAEDDELSKLGGKTRLIKEESKSPSPILPTQSPHTHNPIVPFPLQHADLDVYPNVREYLQSFAFAGHSGVEDAEMSGPGDASVYGQDAGPTMFSSRNGGVPYLSRDSSSDGMLYHGGAELQGHTHGLNGLVNAQLPSQPTRQNSNASDASVQALLSPVVTPHGHGHGQASEHQSTQYFPQYFQVFDYGAAGAAAGDVNGRTVGAAGAGSAFVQPALSLQTQVPQGQAQLQNGHLAGYGDGLSFNGIGGSGLARYGPNGMGPSRRDSPDTSVHNSWMDFVAQLT